MFLSGCPSHIQEIRDPALQLLLNHSVAIPNSIFGFSIFAPSFRLLNTKLSLWILHFLRMPIHQHRRLSAISVASTREVPRTYICEAHKVLDHLEHLAK